MNVEQDVVFLGHVVALYDVDLGILVAFAVEKVLDDFLCAVDDVGRHLAARLQPHYVFQVLAFAFLYARIVDA